MNAVEKLKQDLRQGNIDRRRFMQGALTFGHNSTIPEPPCVGSSHDRMRNIGTK